MAYIILAAGKGIRAKSEEKNLPKVLLKCPNGKSLLVNTLENHNRYAYDKKIRIVMGFLSEKIIAEVETYQQIGSRQEITLVHNVNYEKGVITSLYSGIQKLNEDIIIMNGDTYYGEVVFNIINSLSKSTLLVMNDDNNPDAIKVRIEGDRVLRVGKNLADFSHISIGCLYLCQFHVKQMTAILENLILNPNIDHIIWHNLINNLIDCGEEIYYQLINNRGSFEIDTDEDYRDFLNTTLMS